MIVFGHEAIYLACAGLICVLGGSSARWIYRRTSDELGRGGWLWLSMRALAAGVGAWGANVLSCLAYRPAYQLSLDPWCVVVALPIGVILAAPGLVSPGPGRPPRAVRGAIFTALSFTGVHYAIVAGLRAPGSISWHLGWQIGALCALALCVCLAWGARAPSRPLLSTVLPMGLNTAAIALLHFMSLEGMRVTPAALPGGANPPGANATYATIVVTVAFTLLSLAMIVSLAARLGEQKALLRLRGAVNAMPNAMALFDADDRLVLWNTSFELGRGFHADRIQVGMPLRELAADAPEATASLNPNKGRAPREYRHAEFMVPGGKWLRVENVPTEHGGLLSMASDITALKHDQERLSEALEQAEAASQAKSDFLAAMSHEIRTPLNGVLGMAHALGTEPLTTSQREKLEIIQQGGEALLMILNDILDVSKIEAGRLVLEDGAADVIKIARNVQGIFSAMAREKDVALTLRFDPSAEGFWRGDPMRVQQILLNLVSNAVKFTDAGSIDILVSAAGEGLELRIADTGVGVAEELQGHVFDTFTQADASTTRRFGGSGLGLSICRNLAGLMGGDIALESELGKGSTFIVTLPLKRLAAPSSEESTSDEAPCSIEGLRVLAAEDNAMNQLVLRTLLAPFGVQPHFASNGQEAIAAWEEGGWDVILMDVQMPVMDGLAATRYIRKKEKTSGKARTPLVALTANALTHHRSEYLQCGMDAVVSKPINVTELVQAIELAARIGRVASRVSSAA